MQAIARKISRYPVSFVSKIIDLMHVSKNGALAILWGLANAPSIYSKWRRTGAITFPGSRYIGPGNKLNEGRPTSYADRLAYVHDHQYAELQRKGVNPYTTFNMADRQMLAQNRVNTVEGAAVALGIGAKKIFKADYTPVSSVPSWEQKYGPASKPRPSAAERKLQMRKALRRKYVAWRFRKLHAERVKNIPPKERALVPYTRPVSGGSSTALALPSSFHSMSGEKRPFPSPGENASLLTPYEPPSKYQKAHESATPKKKVHHHYHSNAALIPVGDHDDRPFKSDYSQSHELHPGNSVQVRPGIWSGPAPTETPPGDVHIYHDAYGPGAPMRKGQNPTSTVVLDHNHKVSVEHHETVADNPHISVTQMNQGFEFKEKKRKKPMMNYKYMPPSPKELAASPDPQGKKQAANLKKQQLSITHVTHKAAQIY